MDKNNTVEKLAAPILFLGILFFGFFLVNSQPVKTGEMEVVFLDVGQGDAALVKTPHNKYILVDGGPDKEILNKLGEEMLPGISEIEAVILSHPHADHVSGLNYVLDRYRVKSAYLTDSSYYSPDYEEFKKKLIDYNIPAEKYFEGRNIYIDEVSLDAFWPPVNSDLMSEKDTNDGSIVFRLSYGENSLLFLGDLSIEKQEEMLKKGKPKKVNILKVSHHGSKTGTSETMLSTVAPEYAVISVGEGNRFGHPSQIALKLLFGTKVLRTDKRGSIKFNFTKNSFEFVP